MNEIATSSEVVLKEVYNRALSRIDILEQQLSELKRLIFGVKSERFISLNEQQLSLFVEESEKQEIPSLEEITYSRQKKVQKEKPIRTVLPTHLPRVEEIIEPENLEKGMKRIGEEITEQLEYNPAKVFVRKIIRPKYSLGKDKGIIIADLPSVPLPKSNAGSSMLAHLMVSKFVDHLPFYRQRQIFKRQQLKISDSTLGGWFNGSCDLLVPLYDCLEKKVLQSDYLQMDESPIGVQDNHKKGSLHTGYQWVINAPTRGLVLFKYSSSRSSKFPKQVLKNFQGALQTDGYQVYRNLSLEKPVKLLGCMAHARRYFEKALDNDPVRASYALEQMQSLYKIERKIKQSSLSSQTIDRYRRAYAARIIDELQRWMKENIIQVLPKSSIGKAIAYTLRIWGNLTRYTQDSRYQIDNNLIENTIRPLALGRKNYLFAGSHKAAQRTAMMYSFFATCKVNQIEPLKWLTDVLNRIPEHKANRLEELLPFNIHAI